VRLTADLPATGTANDSRSGGKGARVRRGDRIDRVRDSGLQLGAPMRHRKPLILLNPRSVAASFLEAAYCAGARPDRMAQNLLQEKWPGYNAQQAEQAVTIEGILASRGEK